MKHITINECQMNKLYKWHLTENIEHFSEKESIVMQWLKNHYKPMDVEGNDKFGLPQKKYAFSMLDTNKQMTNKLLTPEMVFFQMQSQFKNIISNEQLRNKFLWDVLNKWFFKDN